MQDAGGLDPPVELPEGFEARAAFLLRLRERGIRDLAVLRAMEAVSRRDFVRPELRPWADRDLALPIGCGQVVPEPLFVARLLSACRLTASLRVLLVGAGSGFTAALLARLSREVVAIERHRVLADELRLRMLERGIANVATLWSDGLGHGDESRFDRIVLAGAVPCAPDALLDLVEPGGSLVWVRVDPDGQNLVRLDAPRQDPSRETIICRARLPLLRRGISPVQV